jgi:hypothetical protein
MATFRSDGIVFVLEMLSVIENGGVQSRSRICQGYGD